MPSKKIADLSSSLVAVKGKAAVLVENAVSQPAAARPQSSSNSPLNFKVDSEFRRRFRQRAAEADLKLNELLREALEAWEEKRNLK